MRLKSGQGIHFRAIPDNGTIRVRVGENNKPHFIFPNSSVWSSPIQRLLAQKTIEFWYPPTRPLKMQNVQWIVNQCADVDEYRNALIGLDQAFGKAVPIFNHPRRVAMTRRDLSSRLLADINGLITPKCVRLRVYGSDVLEKTFAAERFSYPVLVRPSASQSGRGLVRVDSPFDWYKAYEVLSTGDNCFMTQYVDFSNAQGVYVRVRLAFVGSRVFLRGYTEQPSWLIRRAYGDAPDDSDLQEFMKVVEDFDSMVALKRVGEEIRARVGLEYFGVDLGMRSEREFVLFEANAAMSILDVQHGQANYAIIKPQIDRIECALESLLISPKKWVGINSTPENTVRDILLT